MVRCRKCKSEGVKSNIKVRRYERNNWGELVPKRVPEILGCSRCDRKENGDFQSHLAKFYAEEIKRR